MAGVVPNKQVLLRCYTQGLPKESDMCMSAADGTISLKVPPGSDGVLVKNLYLSCDPLMAFAMEDPKLGRVLPFVSCSPNQPLRGYGVSKVVDSKRDNLKKGDLVWGLTAWEEYSLLEATRYPTFKIENTDVPLSYYTGILGMPGLTAYAGFYEVCQPKKGDRVFISAASGAVGQLVGQFAKLMGCYVVGSAGSKEKLELLTNKIGLDGALNYKEDNLDSALKRYFPEGIDIYFDSVGGKMLDAVLLNLRPSSRIAISGMISQYDKDAPQGIFNLMNLFLNVASMRSFTFLDYFDVYPKFVDTVMPLIREGKVEYIEDIVEGLENGPAALAGLFKGKNVGKQVVMVARE